MEDTRYGLKVSLPVPYDEAIVLTMDAPILGRRERDIRTGFARPPGVEYANIRRSGVQRADTYGDDEFKASNTWDDLAWVVANTRLPVVVKGVLHPDDAVRALDLGAAAVDVSNHGGRQLDGVPAGISALPEVLEAVGGRVPVLVDGGVRRGTDVLRAIALGALAVLVARPLAWGLAVGGEAGVRDVLRILREEFENAMALTGCRSVADIDPSLVARADA